MNIFRRFKRKKDESVSLRREPFHELLDDIVSTAPPTAPPSKEAPELIRGVDPCPSASPERGRGRSKSRSESPERGRGRSESPERGRGRSKSKSESPERGRGRSKSKSEGGGEREREGRSRSRERNESQHRGESSGSRRSRSRNKCTTPADGQLKLEKNEIELTAEELSQRPKHMESSKTDMSWMIPIGVMLGSLDHREVQACSISRVPDAIRDPKEDAFKPKLVSIGPLHRGATRHLQLMEEPKWHYMRRFLDQKGSPYQDRRSDIRLMDCGREILKLDTVIRASYGGNIDSEPHDLSQIMIVDGCFLLELLIKLGNYMGNQLIIHETEEKILFFTFYREQQTEINEDYYHDPIFETEDKILSVLNDITMLENQIPFIVLKKLYRKVFPDNTPIDNDHRVANIVHKAFGYPPLNSSGSAHILHLMHLSTVEQSQEKGKRAKQELLCCATRLRAAGIIIQSKPNSNVKEGHKLVDTFNFMICFKDSGKLEIPSLHIKETTEVKWRNLIAWEQSRFSIRCKYTSYALFFKGLICCQHDIELLEEREVIVNESKKNREELLTMFRTISKGAEHMDSSYSELCERLNVYKGKKVTKALRKLPIIIWHHCRRDFEIMVYYCRNWYRILIRDHIPTVWNFIGVVAAALLLVLTIMQTYYSSRSNY